MVTLCVWLQHTLWGDPLESYPTPDILSAEENRAFWVSWEGNAIKFGRGTYVDNDIIINYVRPSDIRHPILAVALATGANVFGEWEVITRQDQTGVHLSHR